MNTFNVSEEAMNLHQDAVLCDLCFAYMPESVREPKEKALQRYHDSGFNFVSLTLAIDAHGLFNTVKIIAAETARLRSLPDKLYIVRSVDDILEAKRLGKLAVGYHFQGTGPLQGDLNMVQTYYDLGIRYMLLAYNQKNLVGDGCHERTDGGLSRFGLSLIQEMNRVGMIIDGTHTGYTTTMEAMEATKDPFIFSHSLCYELFKHDRNIKDDQIKACAKTGGIIGVNGVGFFLSNSGKASADLVCNHIDHIAELVGPEHIGLGLDFIEDQERMLKFMAGQQDKYPADYSSRGMNFIAPEDGPALTAALLSRGYSEQEIRGILGENFLRVARKVWK